MLRELFVYGSLRRQGDAHHLIEPHVESIRPALLESWALYGSGRPYPVAARRPGRAVVGDLVRLSPADPGAVLETLDEYEGPGYERRVCPIRPADPTSGVVVVDAWVYVAAPRVACPEDELIPSGDWLHEGRRT